MNTAPLSAYLTLGIAVILEVISTSLLQRSEQFTRLWPTLGMVLGYVGTFYFLSLTLRTMPLGIVYAVWGGAGVVLISTIGYFVFKQSLDTAAIVGISFIVTGVVIVNALSRSASH